MSSAHLRDLADEPFVLLTTYRRTGAPVATPVWVAGLDTNLVVSTPEGTGKLKRLRHTPRVRLQACSRRGTPLDGAPQVTAHAIVSTDPDTVRAVEAALAEKYSWQWRAAMVIETVLRRGRRLPRPALLLSIDPDAG